MEFIGAWFDKPHNEYIQCLVDVGILGFAAIMAFYVLLFWDARKKLNDTLPLALGVAVLCFLVQAFFNFATAISHGIVWTVIGVFGASAYMQPEEALPVKKKGKKKAV